MKLQFEAYFAATVVFFTTVSTVALPVANQAANPSLVLTPGGGYLPRAAAIEIPAGASIHHTASSISLVSSNGTILHSAPIAQGATIKSGASSASSSSIVPFESGWIADANWYNNLGSPINSFSTSWFVPPVPATISGQTLFIFNSIEPAAGNAILQPVLQFGGSAAGGGNYWAIAHWYVGPSATYFTPLVTVSVGQQLTGLIQLQSISGSSYTYLSSWSNLGGAALQVTTDELVWATETLEVYSVTSSSDFPTGVTQMSEINLSTQASGNPSISWATASDSADSVYATVVADGSVNAVVNIQYPNAGSTTNGTPPSNNGFSFAAAGQIEWAAGCDWTGGDIANELTTGELCGSTCEGYSGCTRFTWTEYNGGTCWLKNNNAAGPISNSGAGT
ncbi:hypothetical protein HK100_003645, partial [Physocladia obscura]